MDRARAMYLGGKEIYAEDKHLNYYSYKDLGLRCSVCGEPVHLRKGLDKKPHFAHFPSTDSKQVEKCKLRLSSYTENTQEFLVNFIGVTKGQKLELFQLYLISLIASNNYSNAIKIVKTSIGKIDFLENLSKEFKSNLFLFKKKIAPIELQDRIALEVIDYLCVESSSSLLKDLICYSLYQVYNSNSDDWSFWIQKKNYPVIFSKLIETLINTPWLEVLHLTYRENINKYTPNSTVKRSDVKLRGLAQTTGKHRDVWHPTLDKAETLFTRFRFNADINHRTNSLTSKNLQVWMDYKSGTTSIVNDGWISLYCLGTVEVIPDCETHAYVSEISKYNTLAGIASKKIELDDASLTLFLNKHPKIKEFYKGIKFEVKNGIISRVNPVLKPVAIRQLVKTQNKVIITPSPSTRRNGVPFPHIDSTVREAERWLQNNYQQLIGDGVKVTVTNNASNNQKVKLDIGFITKQLLRQNWKIDKTNLEETTAISIASRLVAQVTPITAAKTAERMKLGGKVEKVSDLFSPKGLQLWDETTDKPTPEWYSLIALLVRTVAEVELTR